MQQVKDRIFRKSRLEQQVTSRLQAPAELRRGERPRGGERQSVRVRRQEDAQREEGGAKALAPVLFRGRFGEAAQQGLDDAVEDGALVGEVLVERHRPHLELLPQAAHVERRQTVRVDDPQGCFDDALARQSFATVRAGVSQLGRSSLLIGVHSTL